MVENYDPKIEIEKICEEHKIFFTRNDKGNLVLYEDLETAGLLPLVHNELLKFIKKGKSNGFNILIIKDGEKDKVYPIEISYDGGEEKEEDPNKYPFYCINCGARFDKKPLKCSCGGKKIVEDYKKYSRKEIEEDLKKFQREDLLELIKDEISKDHLADDPLKMTLFLTCVSSLSEDPRLRQSMQLTGGTAVGKDNLIKSCLKHLPDETYLFLTSGTQSTLEDDIQDKRLIAFSEINLFREFGANKPLLEVIKQITEEGTSSLKKDLRTNNKQARYEKGDQKSVIFGTTDIQQDEEAGSRFMKGSVLPTPDITEKVCNDTFDNYSDIQKKIKKLDTSPSWIKKVLTYFYQNEKYQVILPYAKYLKEKIDGKYIFDYSNPRARRDVKRLLALTCATAWLYQEQREIIEFGDYKFIISIPQDLINILKYSNEFFDQTYTGFDARLNQVIEFIENHPSKWVDKKEIQEHLNVCKNTINDYCRELCALGVQEGCKGSTLNEQEGERIYDGNRIYYKRVQKGFKKSLVRVQINELKNFLIQRVQKKRVQNDPNIKENHSKTPKNNKNSSINEDFDKSLSEIEPFKLNPFEKSGKKKGLDQFTDEEIKQTGFTREELEANLK